MTGKLKLGLSTACGVLMLSAACSQQTPPSEDASAVKIIPSPVAGCELTPVMMEEFDTLKAAAWKLDPGVRWTAHTPWNGDFGDAKFIDPGPDGPFSVDDGILSITAKRDENGKWTSGLLAAADSSGAGTGTQWGYFEARMKFPPGPGTWPAFWVVPLEPVPGPDGNIELDVVEYYGRSTGEYGISIHAWYDDKEKYRLDDYFHKVPANSLIDNWNTYGVDISPQAIVFYLNREEVWRQPTPSEIDTPMYPIVNLGLGAGWPIDKTPNPSVLLVDYVHVYGRAEGPPDGCPPGLPTQ